MIDDRGPVYPRELGATVAKFRAMAEARGGVRKLSPEDRHAYGEAVGQAILAKQRSEAHQGLPPVTPKARCASGTYLSDGDDIHDALRRQQRASLESCPGKVRRARKPEQWRQLYAVAMKQKKRKKL